MPVTRFRPLSIVVAAAGAILISSAAEANPGWFGSAQYLYGWRSVGSDGAAIAVLSPGPGSIYNAGDINLGGKSAVDLRAGYDGKGWGIDARFLGGFRWAGAKDLGAVGNIRLANNLDNNVADLAASLDSRFSTLEVNIRSLADEMPFTVFGGVRAMDFNDHSHFHLVFPAFNGDLDYTDATRGLGVQVGAERHFGITNNIGFEVLFVDVDVRGGLIEEKTRQTFGLAYHPGSTANGGNVAKTTSGFLEAGINVGHRIGPFSVEAGYRAFFVNRVPTSEGYAAEALVDVTANGPVVYHTLLVQALTIGAKVKF